MAAKSAERHPRKSGARSARGTSRTDHSKQISIEDELNRARGGSDTGKKVFTWLWTTYWGHAVLTVLTALAWIGILLLITGNNFDRFFLFLGISLIIIALVSWVIYVVRHSDNRPQTVPADKDNQNIDGKDM
ncbi:MAG: hypothetical protein ACOX2M_06675 [Fastidiosipilaceae bacterium]|jgi:hypothetical protein